MLGQTSWVSFPQYKAKSSYIIISGNERFFSLTERIKSTINTLSMSYFTYNWHNNYSTRPKFNKYWVGIVYQVPIHNKCSKCHPTEQLHTWTYDHWSTRCLAAPRKLGVCRHEMFLFYVGVLGGDSRLNLVQAFFYIQFGWTRPRGILWWTNWQ